ncbi:MAG: type 4a pilus biogenesis protein PilO [Planctomycetota bacterium]|nr:type 4a pilus biogenesis protein PilO [Planctomycetota bacterium]
MKFGIREIVFIIILTVIPVGAWWFVFRPSDIRNHEMMKQIDIRQEKLQALNRATATIGNLKTEIASLEKAIEFFRSKLPSEKEIDKVLQEVWRLAEANKLTTKSIRTLKTISQSVTLSDPNGPYAEQPISIKLEGSFAGFYGFLLALESQPRIMRIQQMDIEKDGERGEGYIRVDCTVSVFFERSGKG